MSAPQFADYYIDPATGYLMTREPTGAQFGVTEIRRTVTDPDIARRYGAKVPPSARQQGTITHSTPVRNPHREKMEAQWDIEAQNIRLDNELNRKLKENELLWQQQFRQRQEEEKWRQKLRDQEFKRLEQLYEKFFSMIQSMLIQEKYIRQGSDTQSNRILQAQWANMQQPTSPGAAAAQAPTGTNLFSNMLSQPQGTQSTAQMPAFIPPSFGLR